jgi:hypothetical protein
MWLAAGLRLAILDASTASTAQGIGGIGPVICSSPKQAIIDAQLEGQLNDWLEHPTQGSMLRQTLLSFVPEESTRLLLSRTWDGVASQRLAGRSGWFTLRCLSRLQRTSSCVAVPLPQPFIETFLVQNATKRFVPLEVQRFALRLLCGILPTRHMLHRHNSWPAKYPAFLQRPHCLLCNDTGVMETTWHLFADCLHAVQGRNSPLDLISLAMPPIDLVTPGISRSATGAPIASQQGILQTLLALTNGTPADSPEGWNGLSATFNPASGATFPDEVAQWNHVMAAVGLFPAPVFKALRWQQARASVQARRWLRRCVKACARSAHAIWCRRNEMLSAVLCHLDSAES